MSSNNTKKVNNNIEKISTISKNFDELHQIYKDIFNSGELGILESDKDNIYYLDSHNQKKSIEKKFFDLHFSKGIQGNFNRIEESIKNPNLEGRLSDDASFIFLNIFTSGVLGKTCVDRYLSEFTSNLHSFFKENPNSDAKLNLATYISAYSDTQPSINRIKNTTEYFLKHNFIKTSQIASSNYFKHYSVKELIELSDNGLIPKEKIISYCGEQQYSRSVLEAKSKLMIQTHSKEKNKADEHFIIKLGEKYVQIFHLESDGNLVLYKTTDISRDYLPAEDIAKLEQGMYVFGEGKLNSIIEDFE